MTRSLSAKGAASDRSRDYAFRWAESQKFRERLKFAKIETGKRHTVRYTCKDDLQKFSILWESDQYYEELTTTPHVGRGDRFADGRFRFDHAGAE